MYCFKLKQKYHWGKNCFVDSRGLPKWRKPKPKVRPKPKPETMPKFRPKPIGLKLGLNLSLNLSLQLGIKLGTANKPRPNKTRPKIRHRPKPIVALA